MAEINASSDIGIPLNIVIDVLQSKDRRRIRPDDVVGQYAVVIDGRLTRLKPILHDRKGKPVLVHSSHVDVLFVVPTMPTRQRASELVEVSLAAVLKCMEPERCVNDCEKSLDLPVPKGTCWACGLVLDPGPELELCPHEFCAMVRVPTSDPEGEISLCLLFQQLVRYPGH
jgi:hypothetical protein